MTLPSKDQLIDYDPATGAMRSPPRQLSIEISSHCNFQCVHCPTDFGRRDGPPREFMSLEVLERIRPWIQTARFVNLNGIGEPMLAPAFDRFVETCAEAGAEVAFNSNGSQLTPERCASLVAAGIQSIAISLDGMESMQAIRGASYQSIRARILALDQAKRDAGSDLPHLAIAYTMMKRNALELPRLVRDLVGRVRVHSFQVQPLVIHYETLRDEDPYTSEVAAAALESAAQIAEAGGARFIVFRSASPDDERHGEEPTGPGQLGQFSAEYGCVDPFYGVSVQASGRVLACSGALSPELDVRSHALEEVWNHDWYRALRRRLHGGEFRGACASCSFVRGGPGAQAASIREGVEHSQAARFFRGGYGRRQPRRSFDGLYPFLAGRDG